MPSIQQRYEIKSYKNYTASFLNLSSYQGQVPLSLIIMKLISNDVISSFPPMSKFHYPHIGEVLALG